MPPVTSQQRWPPIPLTSFNFRERPLGSLENKQLLFDTSWWSHNHLEIIWSDRDSPDPYICRARSRSHGDLRASHQQLEVHALAAEDREQRKNFASIATENKTTETLDHLNDRCLRQSFDSRHVSQAASCCLDLGFYAWWHHSGISQCSSHISNLKQISTSPASRTRSHRVKKGKAHLFVRGVWII